MAEAVLHLKVTAAYQQSERPDARVNLVAEDLARQVKKHRDKRHGRRESQKPQEPHVADRALRERRGPLLP